VPLERSQSENPAPPSSAGRRVNRWAMAVVLILVWGITASFMAGFVILSINMHVYVAGLVVGILTLVGSIGALIARWYKLAFTLACGPGVVTLLGFAILTARYG
jgi:hypothetical protein